MPINQFGLLLCLSLSAFFYTACSKDDPSISPEVSSTYDEYYRHAGSNDQPPPNRDISTFQNEVLLQWMDLYLELDRYAIGMRPNASARALAYIGLAAYECANPAMPNYQSNDKMFSQLHLPPRKDLKDIDWEMALNACYATVLDHFLLNVDNKYMGKIEQLKSTLDHEFSKQLREETIKNSRDWGHAIANAVISFSQSDLAAEEQVQDPQPHSYEPPTGEGYWTYSAEPERGLFPYWQDVRTFVIAPEQTHTIPPIEYSTSEGSPYYAQMLETYEANNNAREEDGDDLWQAEFWSDDVETLMFSPPARQISIANQLIAKTDLNLQESLALYLKLGFSLNDAAVSTWKYKYEYMVMRPSVYIQEFIDPSFQTNLYRLIPWPNPSFPGYPSGHSCFASAAAGVFIDTFGDKIDFTDRSHEGRTEFRSTPRSFRSFRQMASENAFARVPLGVHMHMDCAEGLRLGYEISDAINRWPLLKPRA